MKTLIVLLTLALSGCAGSIFETPELAAYRENERIDRYNGALYATITPRADIKAMLVSDDIAKVRAGISAFRWTPEGEARFLAEVAMAYGPLCAGTGLTPGTPDFAQCLIYRYESDQNRKQSARDTQAVRNQINSLRQSRPISCNPNIFGGFDCN